LKQAFLNIHGLNIRYIEAIKNAAISNDSSTNESNTSKPQNILFIHGLGSSADRWLDIPDALSLSNLHALALDLPGFGLSDKPTDIDYTIKEFVRFIVGFMSNAGISKASIVGHSLGGYIAAQLATDHSDRVDKLVLIDSSGMLDGPTPLLQQYLDAAMKPSRQAVRAVFEQLVADPIRIPEMLIDGFIHRINQPGARHAFKSAFDNSVHTQIGIEKLKQIGVSKRTPTMIIWGMQDNLIPIKYFRIFQEAIRRSQTVIVEDAGHAPFAEKPAIISEILRQFIICKHY
jgi:2-hydroxy-6-oxonona-2,4-dienedioate hydrolase